MIAAGFEVGRTDRAPAHEANGGGNACSGADATPNGHSNRPRDVRRMTLPALSEALLKTFRESSCHCRRSRPADAPINASPVRKPVARVKTAKRRLIGREVLTRATASAESKSERRPH